MLERARLRRRASGAPGGSLVVGAVGTLALNVTTLVLNFALTLFLTRALGTASYGAYAFAVAWAMVLSALAGLNLSPLVVREVASAHGQRRWGLLKGVLRWANTAVLSASVATVVVAASIGWLVERGDEVLLEPFLLGLLLIPAVSLTGLRQSAMQGLGRVLLGRVPETVVAPVLFLVLAVVAEVTLGDRFDATWSIGSQLLATAAAFGLGVVLLARALPYEVGASAGEFQATRWRASAVPLFAMGVVIAANAQVGTIVLGLVGEPADAGIYAVAVRVTTFVGFVMLAATYPLMPALARLTADGRAEAFRSTIRRSQRAVTLLTLPLAVGIAVLAGPLLELFGGGFDEGAPSVRILAVGELIRAAVGVLAIALLMAGHEAALTRALALGAAANIALALVLAPLLGVEGAALAQAAGAILSSLVLAAAAARRLELPLARLILDRT